MDERACEPTTAIRGSSDGVHGATKSQLDGLFSASSAFFFRLEPATATEGIIHKEGKIMATKQPNILILRGDDIGTWNVSYFSRGMMGYRTPNSRTRVLPPKSPAKVLSTTKTMT